MKSGLRLKGGLTVIVRSLDQRQRKQLLLETISNNSNGVGSSFRSRSYGPIDPDTPKDPDPEPPKSSVSKFVDLVFGKPHLSSLRPNEGFSFHVSSKKKNHALI